MQSKIFIIAISILTLFSGTIKGQQLMSASEMITITPMVPSELNFSNEVKTSLKTRLNQIVTQNGFGSISGQFVLTANIQTVDKQVTATAPQQFVTKLEVSLYVVDLIQMVVINELSVPVTGVDRIENKSIINAVNQIKPKSSSIQSFMNASRSKIIDYYNTQIPALITKAQTMASQNKYDEALAMLAGIPENVNQYPAVAKLMTDIYVKGADYISACSVRDAKAAIAAKDYNGALDALESVDPTTKHAAEVPSIIEELAKGADKEQEDKINLIKSLYELEAQREFNQQKAAQNYGQIVYTNVNDSALSSWYSVYFY